MSFDILPDSISSSHTPAHSNSQAKPKMQTVAAPHTVWRNDKATEAKLGYYPPEKPLAAPVSLSIVSGVLRGYDALVVLMAGLTALLLSAPDLPMTNSYYIAMSLFGTILVMNALHLAGTYRHEVLRQKKIMSWPIAGAWGASIILMAVALMASGGAAEQNWMWLLVWFTLALFLPLLGRAVLALRMDYWRKAGRLRRRVAILGAGPSGQTLLRQFKSNRDEDAAVVGLYDDRSVQVAAGWRGHVVRGNCDDLVEDVRRDRIDMVLIATPLTGDLGLEEAIAKLRCVAVDVCVCSDALGARLPRERGVEKLCGVSLMTVERRPFRDWYGIAKDLEDRIFAACALIAISPILAAIALAIKLDSPGPVIFKQKRYGRNNQLIEVLKFRTMYHHNRDPNATQLTRRNDPRVTRVGAFLRRTSLDELPQFFNVLFGDMSVVGPRPHATLCKAGGVLYQDAVRNYDWRHRVKPGITGWAQVNGWRGETETVEQIQKRVEHDIYYIENWSLLLDATIIMRTVFGGFTGTKAY